MKNIPIQSNLADTLQPYPLPVGDIAPVRDLDTLGIHLLNRSLSPNAALAAGVTGLHRGESASGMWTPTPGADAAHQTIVRWKRPEGILRLVPDAVTLRAYDGIAEDIGLLNGFRIPVDELLTRDRKNTLVLSSPNGISGQIGTVQEIVRLLRHFSLIVLDERLSAFSMRQFTPLLTEWDNLISIQRFPFIMPGETAEFGWIIHPTTLKYQIAEHSDTVSDEIIEEVLKYGGRNTFRAERTITRRKSQLFREMRKLSILSVPYPSWGNALLARIERGDRNDIVAQLAKRGIAVFAPPHENLRQHMRITAVSTEATLALREALIDINREIPG